MKKNNLNPQRIAKDPTPDFQDEIDGFLSLKHILGDPKEGILPIVPVSPSTWWLRVKEGKYPQPTKHGGRTFWRRSKIRALLQQIESGEI